MSLDFAQHFSYNIQMTIQELINQLQQYDPKLPVMLSGYEGGVYQANRVRQVVFAANVNDAWYYGPHEIITDPSDYPGYKQQQGVYLT